jgi:N-acetylneuraminic acid mutarotase
MKLNGINANLTSVSSNLQTDMGITSQITVCIWAKSSNSTWNGNGTLINQRTAADVNTAFILYPAILTSNVMFQLYSDIGSVVNTNFTTVPDITKWNHYAGTYDGKSIKMYFNGLLANVVSTQGTINGPVYALNKSINIGYEYLGGTAYYLDGSVADARIYNTSLTESEITSIMQERVPWSNGYITSNSTAINKPSAKSLNGALLQTDYPGLRGNDLALQLTARTPESTQTVLDTSGLQHHASIAGTTSVTYSVAQSIIGTNGGGVGRSLSFTGTSVSYLVCDGVSTTANSVTYAGVAGSTPRTFAAWVYPTSLGVNNLPLISYGNSADSTNGCFDIYLDPTGNVCVSMDNPSTGGYITKFNTQIPANQWSHVSLVSDTVTYPNKSASQALTCYTANSTNTGLGPLAKARASTTNTLDSTGTLRAWWPLTDQQTLTVFDQSGNTNHGAKYQLGQYTWSADTIGGNVNVARSDLSMAVLNNRMYIMGGLTNPASTTSTTTTVESFDGSKWVYDVPMPVARSLMGCCVHNGNIIVSGGLASGASYVSTVYGFNGTSWSTLSSLSNARAGMSSVSYNGYVYVFGGTGGTMLTTVSRFDGVSWTDIGNITTGRWRTCAVVYRNKMYVISGYTGSAVSTLVQSSTDGITWTTETAIPFGRSSASAVVYNDCIYVFGGSDGSTSPYSSLMQIFNGTSWTTINGALSVTSRDHASVVYNNYIYKAGGYPASAQPATPLVERYGPYVDTQFNLPVAVFNSSNGSNITVANSTTIGDTFTGGLSISAWVKYNTLTGSQIIAGMPASAANTSPFFSYGLSKTGTNLSQFRVGLGSANANIAVTTGTWYHITGTYDLANLRLYESGTLVNTVPFTTAVASSSQSLKMGANVINSELLNGYMRDVRIYNTVLNAGQVAALYNQTADKINSNTTGSASLLRVGRGVTGSLNASNGYTGYMDDIRLYNRALTISELTDIWNGGSGSYVIGTDAGSCLARYHLNANTIGNQIGYYSNIISGTYYQAPTDIFLASEATALSGKVLTFNSNSTNTGYTWAVTTGTSWTTSPPYNTTGFTRVTAGAGGGLDDDYVSVTLSNNFVFYGVSYNTCYIGTNGYLTFGSADGNIQTTLAGHYSKLRIAHYSCDLLPEATGTRGILNYGYSGDKFVVTMQNMPRYNGAPTFTDIANVQIALYLSNATSGTPGTIELNYGQCNTPGISNWIVGLSDRTNGVTPTDGSAGASLTTSVGIIKQTPTILQSNVSSHASTGVNMRLVTTNNGSISATPYNLSVGLFGWWKFNESANYISLDNSGSNLYMQMYPNSINTNSNRGSGPHNQCSTVYNGVNEYSSTVNNLSFPAYGATNSATISGWFRSSTATWPKTGAQCSQRTAADQNTTAMFIHYVGTREIQPRFYSDASTGHGPASVQPSDITQWNHVCSSFNGTDIYTYVNGSLVDTTSDTFTINAVNKPMFIGKDNLGASDIYLPVETSDFRFYNRALTTAEVGQLYNQSPQFHTDTPAGTQSIQLFGIPETRTARYSRWGEITPSTLTSNSTGLTMASWVKLDQQGNHTLASGRNWQLSISPPRPDKLQAWFIGNESNTATTTAYTYGLAEVSATYSPAVATWSPTSIGIYNGGLSAPFYYGTYLQIDSGSGTIADALAGSVCTLSLWTYIPVYTGTEASIICILSAALANVLYLYINGTGTLIIKCGSSTLTSSTTINTATWTHITATVSGTSAKLYVNGSLVYSGTFASSLAISATDKILAAIFQDQFGNLTNYYYGYIGDVKLYNAELTAKEVTALYNAQYYPAFACNTGSQTVYTVNPAVAISANTWTHVGLAYNGLSSHASIYLNGEYISGGTTTSGSRLTLNTGGNIWIGARPGVFQPSNYCDNLQGKLADIRIYPSVLDSPAMSQLANGTYQPALTDGNLLAGLVDRPSKLIGRGSHLVRPYSTTNIPQPQYSQHGTTGYDITLDGVADYLTISADDYLTTAPSRVFTFTTWVNPDTNLVTGTDTNIFSKWSGSGTGNCYKVAYDFASQLLKFSVGFGSSSTTVSVSMLRGAYNHVACVCTGDRGQIFVYINGRLLGSGSITGQLNIATTVQINIGRNATIPAGTYFKGQLCDIRFYEQALTQEMIIGLMNLGSSQSTTIPRLDTSNPDTVGIAKKQTLVSSGLVAWINGDDIPLTAANRYLINDATPYNNRYIVNNVTLATGQIGKAINLTGAATSNVLINPAYIGSQLLNKGFSVSMWAKFSNSVVSGANETLLQVIGTAGTTNNSVIDIRRVSTGSNIVASFGDGGDTGTLTQSIRDTNWHHLAMVYNGNTATGTRITYIDGTPYSSTGGAGPVISAANTWIIGNNSTGTSGANCAIEDFRVYNRALGIDEIKLLYGISGGVSGSSQYQQLITHTVPPVATLAPSANRQPIYISKYSLDNTGQVCDTPLPILARDSLLLEYKFIGTLDANGQVENMSPRNKPIQNYINPAYLTSGNIAIAYNPGVLAGGASISNSGGLVNKNAFYSPTSGNLTVSSIPMDMARDWSVAMWVYTANTTGAQDIWSANWSSPVTAFTNRLSSNSAVGNGLITYQLQSTSYTSNAYLIPDTWTHLAITKGYVGTTSNIVSIYQDGRLTYRNQIAQSSQATQTMVWGANSGNQFSGYMDDIRVYSSRLNDTQIAKLANLTPSEPNPTFGAIHHWTPDSTAATSGVIQDLGSSGIVLKLNNVVVSDTGIVAGGSAGNTSNVGPDGRGSMYFGGSSNAVAYGSRGILGDSARTVSMWMRRTVTSAPVLEESLVSWGDSANTASWFNVMLTTGGLLAVKTSSAATSNVRTSMALLDTSWHHVGVVVLPPGNNSIGGFGTERNIRLFIDGENRTNSATATNALINTLPSANLANGWITLGSNSAGASGYYTGWLDDVRIYDMALTQQELRALYNGSSNYYRVA